MAHRVHPYYTAPPTMGPHMVLRERRPRVCTNLPRARDIDLSLIDPVLLSLSNIPPPSDPNHTRSPQARPYFHLRVYEQPNDCALTWPPKLPPISLRTGDVNFVQDLVPGGPHNFGLKPYPSPTSFEYPGAPQADSESPSGMPQVVWPSYPPGSDPTCHYPWSEGSNTISEQPRRPSRPDCGSTFERQENVARPLRRSTRRRTATGSLEDSRLRKRRWTEYDRAEGVATTQTPHASKLERIPCIYKGCRTTCKQSRDIKRHLDSHFEGRFQCSSCKTPFTRTDLATRHVDEWQCLERNSETKVTTLDYTHHWLKRENRHLLRTPGPQHPLYALLEL